MRRLVPLLMLVACKGPPDGETAADDTADTDASAGIAVVPKPVLVVPGDGTFVLDGATVLLTTPGSEDVAAQVAAELRAPTGLPLDVVPDDGGDDAVRFVLDSSADVGAEGYTLDVDGDGVVLVAGDTDGLYWGAQTLRQLLPPEVAGDEPADVVWEVPFVHVEDAPRFAWRGLMIDVARHFFDVEEIERQVDVMALHKLDRLHLHLTDDQGWRIEISSWPDLTEIGGSTEVGGGLGGYYTQDQYREIVAYAAARHVVVVPEIDLPGHANAAVASYAELNESGEAEPLYTGTSVISTPIWVDGPETAGFVEDVWREVAAITPGPWVHVGGDEAVDVTDDDYDAFVALLQSTVAADGKEMVAWDEVGDAGVTPPYVGQWWIDADRAGAIADSGAGVIASPAEHAYFDMIYDYGADYGQLWAGPVDVYQAYDWDPVPSGADESQVLGVEAALWTELIDSREKVDFMVWPRACATAEVGWAGAHRDWDEFEARLGQDGPRLDAMGIGYNRTREVPWAE